eukprot:2046443-Pyramimonas_sp.AAC.1
MGGRSLSDYRWGLVMGVVPVDAAGGRAYDLHTTDRPPYWTGAAQSEPQPLRGHCPRPRNSPPTAPHNHITE